MTTPDTDPVVEIDADPAVWLQGPGRDADDEENREWLAGAQYALASDFDLENRENGVAYREYLAALLRSFVAWETPADVTFLRLRSEDDVPVPTGLELWGVGEIDEVAAAESDAPAGSDRIPWFADRMLEPGEPETVGESSIEDVEDAPGWRRLVSWVTDGDAPESRVRYVGTYDPWGVAIVRWGGLDPAQTIEAVADTDSLVRSIRIGGPS